VDVFLSAGSRQMDALEQAGLLLKGTRRTLISNQLVLVVPANVRGILGFLDLASPRIRRIAIGDNSVPAGDYARQVLQHFRLSRKPSTQAGSSWLRARRGRSSGQRQR
jgi:molybdate transport system substrate-binding protein